MAQVSGQDLSVKPSSSNFVNSDPNLTKPLKNLVNTNPRQGLVAKLFKEGFDGVITATDKVKLILQVLHPKDNDGFLMAHLRNYYFKRSRYHTGIFLTEYEYNMLIDILTMARRDKTTEDQVFEKNTKTRYFKVTLTKNSALINQQANGRNRYLKLKKKECKRLVRKYARFEHFIKSDDSDSEDSDNDDSDSEAETPAKKPALFEPVRSALLEPTVATLPSHTPPMFGIGVRHPGYF